VAQEVMAQAVAMVLNRELDAEKALAIQKLCQTMDLKVVAYRREVSDAEVKLRPATRVRRIQ
jgi:hypothetical protein